MEVSTPHAAMATRQPDPGRGPRGTPVLEQGSPSPGGGHHWGRAPWRLTDGMLRVLDCGSFYLADRSPPQARAHGADARQAWASVLSQQPLCRCSGRLLLRADPGLILRLQTSMLKAPGRTSSRVRTGAQRPPLSAWGGGTREVAVRVPALPPPKAFTWRSNASQLSVLRGHMGQRGVAAGAGLVHALPFRTVGSLLWPLDAW